MRILLLCHSFNSLSQRLHVDLREAGHDVTVELDVNDALCREAVALSNPDLIVAPFLKRAVPHDVISAVPTFIVHPGPPGDRGPSALDWAILNKDAQGGVTILQAEQKLDGGPVWAWRTFPLRPVPKSSLYRNEVTKAASSALAEALSRFENGDGPLGRVGCPEVPLLGRENPLCKRADRAIDWAADDVQTVLRKIKSADGQPGAVAELDRRPLRVFDAHAADGLNGAPGALLAKSAQGAVAIGTRDGAVWVGYMREDAPRSLKLPAVTVLQSAVDDLALGEAIADIRYEERGDVGYLYFDFQGGALTPNQSERLLAAYQEACSRPTKIVCLMGGSEYWSNGIHLGWIEQAESPADASWHAINAIDDLARAIITTTSHLVVAALRGNAGAGGVFLALGADRVIGREGVVLNPHYKDMGNLFGSEYWTYVLPRRVGEEHAAAVMQTRLPVGMVQASGLGLVDDVFEGDVEVFDERLKDHLAALSTDVGLADLLEVKRTRRKQDEAEKPLESYRAEELAVMKLNFYGFDPSYHIARYNFICRVPKSRTPASLARHRAKRPLTNMRKGKAL
ncbi:enoyl-CoA hydratase-related protein [Magnetovibrio blakemorei]|uniref:Hydrogenase maturation protein n=1 Tax=Magnetovibrio blakemorei TaxID=28181 RepID=A0A1E5Q502_9PROT|nr:enoyl-CoA hydratase-related protein [Magnetovibrio blakemorei]OEJ65344.1 hydrogenase maturation protein [Magnetovibrio blakemorei]